MHSHGHIRTPWISAYNLCAAQTYGAHDMMSLMSITISSKSHVNYKKCLCLPVDFKSQGTHTLAESGKGLPCVGTRLE